MRKCIFPTQIWDSIVHIAFPAEMFQMGRTSIIGYFQAKGWVVEEDGNAERDFVPHPKQSGR